jgi:hypothetical protein
MKKQESFDLFISAYEKAKVSLLRGDTKQARKEVLLPDHISETALRWYYRKEQDYFSYLVRFVVFSLEMESKYNFIIPKYDNGRADKGGVARLKAIRAKMEALEYQKPSRVMYEREWVTTVQWVLFDIKPKLFNYQQPIKKVVRQRAKPVEYQQLAILI